MARYGHRGVFLLFLAMLATWPGAVSAQNAGALKGRVLDDRGQPLGGATITVSGSGDMVVGRGALSGLDGSFIVPSLPPANDYTIQATFPAHTSITLTDVSVVAGQITRIEITMQSETVLQERVEVRGKPQVVSLESTTSSTRFSSEFIDSMPILGRNYQDMLTLAPGVSDIDGDGNVNIHGARDTDVITLVDGVSTSDPLTGKLGAQLNIESIQEIEIKTSGATAEFSRAQGGFANIVTKSGGNDFQGTFKVFWQGSALDGDGAGGIDPMLHAGIGDLSVRDKEFNTFLPFLSFEGPIVRDRAWFFMAHEYVRVQDPINALTSTFVTSTKEWREFLKLTWQMSTNNRLAFSLNYDPLLLENQGLSSLALPETGYTVARGGPILTLRDTAILSPLVSLDTMISSFDERPSQQPTLDPDTNGNGILSIDRNQDGFFAGNEIDVGDDYDNDGAFDVFEDSDGNGVLTEVRERDPVTGEIVVTYTEDRDGDQRLISQFTGYCEGARREDRDCDGRLDVVDEDPNRNGRCDPGEPCDRDFDGHLDRGDEDRNGNNRLDDRPFPDRLPLPTGVTSALYPYGATRPEPADRQFTINQRRGVISGPYFEDFQDERQRFTFRQDLSVFVPDYWGSHDVKTGFVIERESFSRLTRGRPVFAPILQEDLADPNSTIRLLLPAETSVNNTAENTTIGFYIQDTLKPFPNVSIGLGLRFDREATDSFGYTQFDPRGERAQFDRLNILVGGEAGKNDLENGNNDGLESNGITSDPMLYNGRTDTLDIGFIADAVLNAAKSRMTRHRIDVGFISDRLKPLFPKNLDENGEVNADILRSIGVTEQQPESFRLTNNNLAPRISVSWDPWADGRTKMFATWGRYYDKLFLDTVVGEEGPDTINRYYRYDQYGVSSQGVPTANIGNSLSKAPPSTTQIDRGLATPYSDEFTLGFEREIAPEVAFSITYISRNFNRQLQDIDINHTLRTDPQNGTLLDEVGRTLGTQPIGDGRPDLYINNFFFNQVLRVGNFNESRYRAFVLSVVKRLSRRWELQSSYVYSRAVGAAEDFSSSLGNDPSTVESEFGALDFDQRHVIKISTTMFLPRDWQIGFSGNWSSGLPYSIVSRFFAQDDYGYQQYRTRFGYSEKIINAEGDPELVFRTLPRNSERNPAFYDFNFRARKTMVFGKVSAGFFIEVFNLLNSDSLRIFTYEPTAPEFRNPAPTTNPDPQSVLGPIQLDAQRRFGRRFQLGFQLNF